MAGAWTDMETAGSANLKAVKNGLDTVRRLELKLVRRWLTSNTSIGKLSLNGLPYCYTLEDVTRSGEKIRKETAIPYGTYPVLMTVSGIAYKWNTPGNLLPLLSDVPDFSGIRIHPGTKKENTEGCILTGFTRSTDQIGKSEAAFWPLFELIRYAAEQGYPVVIRITNYDKQVLAVLAVVFGLIALFFIARYIIQTIRS